MGYLGEPVNVAVADALKNCGTLTAGASCAFSGTLNVGAKTTVLEPIRLKVYVLATCDSTDPICAACAGDVPSCTRWAHTCLHACMPAIGATCMLASQPSARAPRAACGLEGRDT